jgi:hypothetical protein
VAVLDTIIAAESLFTGFAKGGNSQIAMTMDSGATPEGRAEERRLRARVDDIPRWVRTAENFYADSRMVPLVCSAGAVIPDDSTITIYDPPAPLGFLLIGGGATLCHLPETGSEAQVSAEAFTAFLWATFDGQLYIHRFERTPNRWFLLDATSIRFDAPLAVPARAKDHMFRRRIVIPGGRPDAAHHQVTLPVGPEARELLDAPESPTSDATIRWLLACWRLTGQTVTEVVDDRLTRQQRRQLERKNVPARQVTVVRLRRRGAAGSDEKSVLWSHRWVVRGHWRQQPCKDENGEWTTRPVFIHPYIKGPDTAPLLVRRRVNHLVQYLSQHLSERQSLPSALVCPPLSCHPVRPDLGQDHEARRWAARVCWAAGV